MASKIDAVAPTVRDMEIEGYPVRVTMGADGITIEPRGVRGVKGSIKRGERPKLTVSWTTIAELGAEKAGGESFYTLLGLE